jgi:hypothetical protein
MIQEILGTPGMNRGLAATKINEAFQKIQNENVWSFQCITGGWLTPPLLGTNYTGYGGNQSFNANTEFLSPGTITVQPFTNQITGDAVATYAWNNLTVPPLLTQYQIRIPYYSLYSIIAQGNNGTVAYATALTPGSGQTPGVYITPVLDPATGAAATLSITVDPDGTVTKQPTVLTVGSGYTTPYVNFSQGGTPATFSVSLIAVLTIDRLWTEPQQIQAPYLAYQAYYALPPGFKRLFNARDTTNNVPLFFSRYTQIDLAEKDAERTVFDQPTDIVPYMQDTRVGSATFGQQLVELWPHPISQLPYTFMCQCNWPALVNATDTLPYPLSEELVKFRTYQVLALWQESQKGTDIERGAGANWQFLWGANKEEYKDDLRQIRIMDRHLMELYFQKAQVALPANQDGYMTMNGELNVGVF